MFDISTYVSRRRALKEKIKNGLLIFLGNDESPMNYAANPYHFRQDSTFLYYFGLDEPAIQAIVDLDENAELLFGTDPNIDDIIWMGPQLLYEEKAKRIGIESIQSADGFKPYIQGALKKGRKIHYLPPYRPEHLLKLSNILGINVSAIPAGVSTDFIKAVIAQRSIKTDEEVNEIENAHAVSYEMQIAAMKMAKPGLTEREIAGTIEGIALSMGVTPSFPIILSVHGEILHNHYHGNRLEHGNLLINDSGAESELRYAADITRTVPVGGKFNNLQKEIYEIVLAAQNSAIESIRPKVRYLDIHLKAAKIIAEGLKGIGFMKGNIENAVEQGAHALFFPHGLGHMLGLDVHDMENLGEDLVGYDKSVRRSEQFGLAYLRLAKKLEPGYVLTVEPGIYFIPQLIDLWRSQKKHAEYIDYPKIELNKKFGGIRIEDDVLVTEIGYRVIGKIIPKTIKDLEEICLS